jgi:molybdopterin synthase sulfur carrier subunit
VKVKIRLFATFREVFNSNEIELRLRTAGTIKNLLEVLCNSNERRQELLDRSGDLKPYIKVLKNGRNIDFLGGMDTRLADGDVVAIFPPVGGG